MSEIAAYVLTIGLVQIACIIAFIKMVKSKRMAFVVLSIPVCYIAFHSAVLSWPNFFQFLISLPIAIFFGFHNPRIHYQIISLLLAFGMSVVWCIHLTQNEFRRIDSERREYPLYSLTERLAPERRHVETHPEFAHPLLNQPLTNRQKRHDSRSYGFLDSLHEKNRKEFAVAYGFGWNRMPLNFWFPQSLHEPVRHPNLQPQNSESKEPSANQPGLVQFQQLDKRTSNRFRHSNQFGAFLSHDQVVGFQPHTVQQPFPLIKESDIETEIRPWIVNRIDLVGIFIHESPVVYLTENLPRMDELSAEATRPLNDWENEALKQLQSGEQLVVAPQTHPHMIHAMGAIRTDQNCFPCHSVKEGSLLGAFTYELIVPKSTTR